jgi:diphthamide synthase (EF-2-diphthine--ammonia ligase)
MKKTWLSWSSGKDSAWTLQLLRQRRDYEVSGLLTTVNNAFDRVSIHAVRRVLLEEQARAVRLPLHLILLPWPCSNTEYETIMAETCAEAVRQGIAAIAFGDLFLNDIREYRIKQLKGTGLEPIFPLWNLPTGPLAEQMIASGMRAKLTCIDPGKLSSTFAGRDYDSSLLVDLPDEVDPCGENGEFHSFAYDGPMFQYPLQVEAGKVIERDGFVFADLLQTPPSGPQSGT